MTGTQLKHNKICIYIPLYLCASMRVKHDTFLINKIIEQNSELGILSSSTFSRCSCMADLNFMTRNYFLTYFHTLTKYKMARLSLGKYLRRRNISYHKIKSQQ